MSDNASREQIALRLSPGSLARVDRIAREHEWTRSQMIRTLLRLGIAAWDQGKR